MTTKRFRALRTIAVLLKILAWVSLVTGLAAGGMLIALGGTGSAVFGTMTDAIAGSSAGGAAGMAGGIAMIFMSVVYFLFLLAAAEGIHLLLAVESHARDTAELMKEMWVTFGPPKPKKAQSVEEAVQL